jgi:hypothetical protein
MTDWLIILKPLKNKNYPQRTLDDVGLLIKDSEEWIWDNPYHGWIPSREYREYKFKATLNYRVTVTTQERQPTHFNGRYDGGAQSTA